MTFYKNNWKRELAHKDEHILMKQKVIILEVKFEWNINEITEEISDWYVDTATIGETLDKQLEELRGEQLST